MCHLLVLVGPHQRLFAEDLCIKAGVIKADSAVLDHVFCEARLQGCYWMREPVVQLVHLVFIYQADGSARRKIQKEKNIILLCKPREITSAQQAHIKQLSINVFFKQSGMPVLLYT